MMTTDEQESSSSLSSWTIVFQILFLVLLLLIRLIAVFWERQYDRQRHSSSSSTIEKQHFTHFITVTRHLPTRSLQQAYARCLRAWRVDNLGLPKPPLSFLQPMILKSGHVTTGVGLICQRWMPLAAFCFACHLQEGIVGFQESSTSTSNTESSNKQEEKDMEEWMQMEYKVLNPSYCTWPVYHHLGRVRFTANTKDSGSGGGGCRMEWTVQWTPLPLPTITIRVIEMAGNYMAAVEEEEEQQQEQPAEADAKKR
jgi:hypothetical protein